MKKKISSKALKRMKENAARGVWYNLVRLADLPTFARWLAAEKEWQMQSPDVGECMRAHKHGETVTVTLDRRGRTTCQRHVMALWLTYECFGKEWEDGQRRSESENSSVSSNA